MSNYNRPYNHERDLITKFNKNNHGESDYVNEKINIHTEKFKNDNYDFKEYKNVLNPIFDPNALIGNQIDFNQKPFRKEYFI
jgi:hypothetical protein